MQERLNPGVLLAAIATATPYPTQTACVEGLYGMVAPEETVRHVQEMFLVELA